MSTSATANQNELMFNELELGWHGCSHDLPDVGHVMFVSIANQPQLQGNLMHCTARGNIAHNFLRLKEGSIYSVKKFTMYANKDDFRLLRFAHFMLELDGDTVVWKSSVSSNGFDRYPFQFVEFDSLKPTNNKYLINVVGHITIFWPVRQLPLWTTTIMSIVFLTDGNCECIVCVLKQLKTDDSGVELTKEMISPDNTEAKAGTLENLVMWARNQKYDSSTFHYVVRIDKVKTKKGWNYPSCGGEKCKKNNLNRKDGRFWCDSRNSSVDYPVIRYRLELEIFNATVEAVVVMFDERAKILVKCFASSIEERDSGLPPALPNIKVVEEEDVVKTSSSETIAATANPKAPVLKILAATPSVGYIKDDIEDSDAEESSVADNQLLPDSIVAIDPRKPAILSTLSALIGANIQSHHLGKYEFRNNHVVRPSLSNILHTFVMIHSNTIINRDGNVQSFYCLKLSDIRIPDTGTPSRPGKRATNLKGKAIADTCNPAISEPTQRTTGLGHKRLTKKGRKLADLASSGTEVFCHSHGAPSYECRSCNATMWYEERINKGNRDPNPTFSLCCQQGTGWNNSRESDKNVGSE
ncbi:reverse transcriptase domain-containing protein [Tanacetum coccineum]